MKQDKQKTKEPREEDITNFLAACVEAMKGSIVLSDPDEDILSLPDGGQSKREAGARMLDYVGTACRRVRDYKVFRRVWVKEAKKLGISPSKDSTELVVSVLYNLTEGEVSSNN